MLKYISIFIITIIITSCQTRTVQVIEDVYQDGSPKSIIDYKVSFGDSIPQHRIDFHIDGSRRMEGNFVNGKREGEWISWHPNGGGIWSKGYFKNGERTGKSWIYHTNGKLYMKGAYENGKKVGLWLVFDEDGNVVGQDEF